MVEQGFRDRTQNALTRNLHIGARHAGQSLAPLFGLNLRPGLGVGRISLNVAQADQNLAELMQKSEKQVASACWVQSIKSQQLPGRIAQTGLDGAGETFLDRISDRQTIALLEGDGCCRSTRTPFVTWAELDWGRSKRHTVSQAKLQRAPDPEQQCMGTP